MKINWILIALFLGIVGGGITYGLTDNVTYALISAVLILIVVLIHNPATRYLKIFYVVLFPLLSNFYFTLSTKTDNFDFEAGLKEMGNTTIVVLGTIAVMCLLLDYLERNGKLKGIMFSYTKKKIGGVTGNNNNINQ